MRLLTGLVTEIHGSERHRSVICTLGFSYRLVEEMPSTVVLLSLILHCELRDTRGMNSPSFDSSIRKVCALVAATLILPALVSLSFSVQAAEKKKITGTNKQGPPFPAPSCLQEMIQSMNWSS
jgi:hypothetical protein